MNNWQLSFLPIKSNLMDASRSKNASNTTTPIFHPLSNISEVALTVTVAAHFVLGNIYTTITPMIGSIPRDCLPALSVGRLIRRSRI